MLMWGVGKDEMKGKHDLSTTLSPSKVQYFDLVILMMPSSTGAGFCPLIDVDRARIM